ncbi:MAG: hypothetical protein JWO31_2145 [Phycisphaerales bacterium]|nr:hypothetical protein [Phycisphaerales bacterium]
MATTELHGTPAYDARRVPQVSTAIKIVGACVAILFSIGTYIIPSGAGRLYGAMVATGFAIVGLLRPRRPQVWLMLFSWLAAVMAVAAIFAAVMDLTNAAGPANVPVPQ